MSREPGALSIVEQALCADPGAAHAAMDFNSRDRYCPVIARVAGRSGLSEPAVASHAIELAQAGAGRHGSDAVEAHVGHY